MRTRAINEGEVAIAHDHLEVLRGAGSTGVSLEALFEGRCRATMCAW